MSFVTENQPDGTPTWIDLGIPDLERAMEFYGALFGWEFEVGPAETMRYTECRLDGRPVAALAENPDPEATAFWWNMYLATGDCDATVRADHRRRRHRRRWSRWTSWTRAAWPSSRTRSVPSSASGRAARSSAARS